jgi:hypothetical protein
MKEFTVKIMFVQPSLGNVKDKDKFVFLRNPSTGAIMFMPSWHRANMIYAAKICNRLHKEVLEIAWNPDVCVVSSSTGLYRRYYNVHGSKARRYAVHESLEAGTSVEFTCVVPNSLSADDLHELMATAGKYKGISPAKPQEFGRFTVVAVESRRAGETEDKNE